MKKVDKTIKEVSCKKYRVRIDRFLQHTYLYLSRKEAKDALSNQEIFINDKIAKPSTSINDGDILYLNFDSYVLTIKAKITQENNKIYVGYDIISKNRRNIISC